MSRLKLIAVSLTAMSFVGVGAPQTAFGQTPPPQTPPPAAEVSGLPFPTDVIPLLRSNNYPSYSAKVSVAKSGNTPASAGTITFSKNDRTFLYEPESSKNFYMVSRGNGELDTVFPAQKFYIKSSVPPNGDSTATVESSANKTPSTIKTLIDSISLVDSSVKTEDIDSRVKSLTDLQGYTMLQASGQPANSGSSSAAAARILNRIKAQDEAVGSRW